MVGAARGEVGTVADDEARCKAKISVDEALSAIGIGLFQYKVWLVCCLGVAADGVEKATLMYVIQAATREWGIEGEPLGFLGSTSGVGQALGSIAFGRMSDAWGRRFAFLAALGLTFIFGVLCAIAPNYATFLALRLVANVGVGGALPVAFTLLAEYLPESQRPRWMPMLYVSFGVGRLLTGFLAYLIFDYSWRLYVMVVAVPCGLLLLIKGQVPETPQYFASCGRQAEARAAIAAVAAQNCVASPVGLDVELHNQAVSEAAGGPDKARRRWSLCYATALLGLLWLLLALGNEWSFWALKILLKSAEGDGISSDVVYRAFVAYNANEFVVPLLVALLPTAALAKAPRCMLFCAAILSANTVAAFGLLLADKEHSTWLLLTLANVANYCCVIGWVFAYVVTPGYFPAAVRGSRFGIVMMCNRLGYICGPLVAASLVTSHRVALILSCACCHLAIAVLMPFLPAREGKAAPQLPEEGERTRLAGDAGFETGRRY